MNTAKEKRMKKRIFVIAFLMMVAVGCIGKVTYAEGAEMYLSKTALTLEKGSSKKLKIKNLPEGNPKVTWSTSNKYAATVTKKGKVKAKNYGTTTITATCGKKSFTCYVTIPDTTRNVTLNVSSVTIQENASYQLVAVSANKVSYHSGNESIATVTSKGVIQGVNAGIVTITAKSATGYAACVVTVTSCDTEQETPSWVTNKNTVTVRRLTKNNHMVYDYISWAKGKNISFQLAGVDESAVKKCVWSTSDSKILSMPSAKAGSKIQSEAKTISAGTAVVKAVVTYTNGTEATYSNTVFVTAPAVNTKKLTLFGPSAGSNRQQFISFCGLSSHSKITWSNSNPQAATISPYNTKAALWGISAGSGTVTASVDGKTYQINYTVELPVFGSISSVIAKGKTTKINISGLTGITPVYSVRNSKVATVDSTGTITGKSSGVTYVDVQLGSMFFFYRVEVAATGMKKIIKRANYIVNNWKYSQKKRMKSGYYDCSSLVWKGYKKYKKYHKKLGSAEYALPAGELFDYLYSKNQIVYFGYTSVNDLKAGDLIFYGDYDNAVKYSTPGRTLNIYHVSMYAGAGNVVEKGGQTISYNGTNYIVGIGRVVN